MRRCLSPTGIASVLWFLMICVGHADSKASAIAEQCAALSNADFSATPDAPAQIVQITPGEATHASPPFCRVRGYVAPQIGFELQLPITAWNGKFLHVGCGANCGTVDADQCEFAVRRGYACIVSNMGHASTGFDGKWSIDNLQAVIDFAYRATHVVTVAGKAISERLYGRAPERSYFVGCSQGGRQGLVEAQRFPEDFDGIVAGAPVIHKNMSSLHLLWIAQLLNPRAGTPTISPADIASVQTAVLSRCDAADGLVDGLISNPAACTLDPSELSCRNGSSEHCLTDAQVDVVRKMYAGVRTSSGAPVYWGVMRGSESEWPKFLSDGSGRPTTSQYFATEHLRYLAFMPAPGPAWQPGDLNVDRDPARFGLTESLYSAANPDLRHFKSAGGKLLLYSGWSDPFIPPSGVVDYYETMTRTMGGPTDTRSFARLFMLPGVGHCGGGAGANAIDYLGYLERWVEKGEAPQSLLAAHLREPPPYAVHGTFPLPAKNVAFTRPVFPYPGWPRYKGTGDPRRAESFEAAAPP